MRVILDGFDGSFLPILQSFKAVMPSLRITGIEELGQSVKEAPSKDADNADAINVSELFARRDERDELLSDESLFLQDDKFDDSDEATAVKFESTIQANDDAKFEPNLTAMSERKTASVQEQNLQEMQNATPYQDGGRDAKMAVSDDSAQAALFDFNESGQNSTPRAEPKAALERKKHESASLFTDEEVRAILELK